MQNKIVQTSFLRDQATNIIRTMILSGEYKHGESLSERKLSIRLGISTTPIKEALRVLQSEGLLVTLPRKGSFVSKNLEGEIIQLTFLRSAVDSVAAYFAAQYATKEQVAQMQGYLDKALNLVKEKGEVPALNTYNDAFHETIREVAGSFMIVNLGANMQNMDKSIRRRINDEDFAGALKRHEEHQGILELIAKGDSIGAEKAMRSHIRQGIRRIVI